LTSYNIGIYLFDNVEVLDFAGPFEVFSTAARLRSRQGPDAGALFDVFTIAEATRLIRARGGLRVRPQYDFADHPPVNVLIIPGGIVSDELERETVVDWITRCAASASITASVCTGAFLLGRAGLLDGKPATTHWEDIPDLRAMYPGIEVKAGTRWVDTGQIVSSAGISAGIDMSLHLVERLDSKELALSTARQMEFDWQDSGLSLY
jgi:transcriptional regulator GlxA family with amidase domain